MDHPGQIGKHKLISIFDLTSFLGPVFYYITLEPSHDNAKFNIDISDQQGSIARSSSFASKLFVPKEIV